MKLKTTKVYKDIKKAFESEIGYRNILLQGGTRSSKTYSLCQFLIIYALSCESKLEIDIVRKSFPSLRATVMKDFFEILHSLNLYDVECHQSTLNTYTLNNCTFSFYSLDDSMKIHGRKRDILWINESNEIDYDTYVQLNIRTTLKLFFDFNPSELDHFLNTELSKRSDSITLHSTYKDNQFLSKVQIDEIERLKLTDESYYQIYCLGNYSVSKQKIYNHYQTYKVLPDNIKDITYGLDFGFNHPTALLKIYWTSNNEAFVEQLIYESNLTANDLINRMRLFNINGSHSIFCDYARPEMIEEIKRAGFKAQLADKAVKAGIDKVKSTSLFINENSTDTLNEISKYSWKIDTNNKLLDEPIKLYDDAMDALRYGIMGKQGIKKYSARYVLI